MSTKDDNAVAGLTTNPMPRRTNRILTIYSSLAIKQNTLSLKQVTAVLNGKRVIAPPKDIAEVKNAYEIYEMIDSLNPYSVDALLNYVINPIGTILQALAESKAAKTLIAKIAKALEENIREEGLERKTALESSITVNDLSFGYEPEKPVLQNVSFAFDAGKSYAIVGASGSGKKTTSAVKTAAV